MKEKDGEKRQGERWIGCEEGKKEETITEKEGGRGR